MIWADCVRIFAFIALFFYLSGCFLFFLFWTRPKIKLMKNYMAKNKRKMEMIHFFLCCYHLSYNSLVNSIFTVPNMEQQQQCKTKKRSEIFIRNHIIIYEVLRKDISFCSFIIYSQLYIYPFPLGPRQCPSASICYAMSWQCCWLYSFVWCFFQLCAILLLFSLNFPNVSFSLSGFVISLMHANYIPTFFMRIIWPL